MKIEAMTDSQIRMYLFVEETRIVAAKKNKLALLHQLVQIGVATDPEITEYEVLRAEAVEKQSMEYRLEKQKERMRDLFQIYLDGEATDEEKEELDELEALLK